MSRNMNPQLVPPSAGSLLQFFIFFFKFIHLKSKNITKPSSKESLSFEALIEFADTDD